MDNSIAFFVFLLSNFSLMFAQSDLNWDFYQGKDSWDGVTREPQVSGLTIEQIKEYCMNNNIGAFNTNGYLKTVLYQPFRDEPTFRLPYQGLYVRKNFNVISTTITTNQQQINTNQRHITTNTNTNSNNQQTNQQQINTNQRHITTNTNTNSNNQQTNNYITNNNLPLPNISTRTNDNCINCIGTCTNNICYPYNQRYQKSNFKLNTPDFLWYLILIYLRFI